MPKRQKSPEWYAWCIELGELLDQRERMTNHPHSLGEAWERGVLKDYDERIAALRAAEPPQYPPAH